MDKLFHVAWEEGEIILHAATDREARAITLEYFLANNLIKTQETSQDVPGPVL